MPESIGKDLSSGYVGIESSILLLYQSSLVVFKVPKFVFTKLAAGRKKRMEDSTWKI